MLSCRYWLIFVVIVLSARCWAKSVQVEAKLDREAVPLDKTVWLTISLTYDGPPGEVEVVSPPEPKCRNAAVISSRASDETSAEGERQRSVRRYQFALKPETLGMAYIEPVSIVYRRKGQTDTQTLTTNRLSFKALPAEEEKIPVAVRVSVVIVAALLLAAIVAFVVKRHSHPAEAEGRDDESSTMLPAQELCRRWTELEKAAGTHETERTLFTEALQLLRALLAEAYGSELKSAPLPRLAIGLTEGGMPAETVEGLQRAFSLGERVKFANYEPNLEELGEAWRALRRAGAVIIAKITKEATQDND